MKLRRGAPLGGGDGGMYPTSLKEILAIDGHVLNIMCLFLLNWIIVSDGSFSWVDELC